jgi:hypothetical protein
LQEEPFYISFPHLHPLDSTVEHCTWEFAFVLAMWKIS